MITLFLLAAFQAMPVDDLIRSLGDDSIEEREKAVAELFALGEAARPALDKVIREISNVETRARAGDVLGRLDREKRIREFKGGAVSGDLGARLTISKDEKTGQRIFTTEIMNVGSSSRTIAGIRGWNTRLPGMSSSTSRSEAEVSVTQLSGTRPTSFGGRYGCGGSPPQRDLVTLAPGESRTYSYTMAADALLPGEYEVRVTYLAMSKRLVAGVTEDLKSNVQKFTVEK